MLHAGELPHRFMGSSPFPMYFFTYLLFHVRSCLLVLFPVSFQFLFIQAFHKSFFEEQKFLNVHQNMVQHCPCFKFFPALRQRLFFQIIEKLFQPGDLLIRRIDLHHIIHHVQDIVRNHHSLEGHTADLFHFIMQVMEHAQLI